MSQTNMLCPDSLDEALRRLAEHTDAVVLAGGTDLWPQWTSGQPRPDRVLSLHRLAALRRIERQGDRLRIGATCTHTDLVRSEEVRRASPALRASAAVATQTTPGSASARDVSMRSTFARGCSDMRTAPCSMSGRRRSAT